MFPNVPAGCRDGPHWLSVAVECEGLPASYVHTYWNFTLLDQFTLDYWAAVDGDNSEAVPNWSIAPNWLYSPTWNYQDDYREPFGGYETGAAPAGNLTALGDYYGRLLAWYTRGGFVDENAIYRHSGHNLNISTYEIFNEVDYEHGHTPRTYTAEYDAIVLGIRRHADPFGNIAFVGLSLPNIDSTDTVLQFASYFLDARNHDPAVGFNETQNYIGYHSYPTNGPYTPSDPSTLSNLFTYGDSFVQRVRAVDSLIAQIAPGTQTYLDECGTDMDQMVSVPHYWVASGSLFAYLFASISNQSHTTVQVGQSQLADGPGQEPSVAILDWNTGNGTARYAVNALLIDLMGPGDAYLATTVQPAAPSAESASSALFAQLFVSPTGVHRVLAINRVYAVATVALDLAGLAPTVTCSIAWVDVGTPLPYGSGGACTRDTQGRLSFELAEFATAIVTLTE